MPATELSPRAVPLPTNQASLLIQGTDQPGIVSAVTAFIHGHGGNIVSLDQFSDNPEGGNFFQRTIVHFDNVAEMLPQFTADLAREVTDPLNLSLRVRDLSIPYKVAIFASKSDHCLLDLLWRQRRGELAIEIPLVVSNHTDLQKDVESFGIPFFHVPSQGPDKSAAEAEHFRLVQGKVDLVVLARYMQIISPEFIDNIGAPIINIHHSFLPAFIGAGPYAKAKERGVKLIGATAHYVTQELDEGPIIEQDVARVSHVETAAELQRRGADVERAVLSRAVRWHTEDRVLRYSNHTVVFPG
ncbi:MAG TPA: formyltetrahydrofolate deformylase [Pseudolysinimonas sp.]|nr:formyltetrahydrofolate deformylase [Pseudolysinimonas sp.]